MLKSKEDILVEIDFTIDRLLQNSDALKEIASDKNYQDEISALEKTQESLIAHLIHMDDLLKKKATDAYEQKSPLLHSTVHNKLGRSGYLNKLCEKKKTSTSKLPQEEVFTNKPKIHKRKVLIAKKGSQN